MSYLIGIDGGATGTIGVLADTDGRIRAMARAGASNHIVAGKGRVAAVFQELISSLLGQTGYQAKDCQTAVFGLAALAGEADRAVYQKLIEPLGLGGTVIIESDVVIAWAAGTLGKAGIAVIAGTGSSCFGINAQGERFRALGWDYVLADQGSGFWIGSQGLKTAMKQFDGRIENSLLLDAMIQHYKLDDAKQMLTRAYEADFGKDKIAGFGKAVVNCAQRGDQHAQAILDHAAKELAEAVKAVAKRLNMTNSAFPLGLIGGVWRGGEVIMLPFREAVLSAVPHAQIAEAQYPAVVGALILAKHDSEQVEDTFLAKLDASDLVQSARAK